MRHHNPAWWPSDDCFGRATPDNFVQPGVAIGTHDQKVDGVSLHICLEHFSNCAAVDSYRFKSSLDSMFSEMAYEGCPGFQFRRRVVVGRGDDAHIRSRLKPWQRVGHRSCGRRGMIPGDDDAIECHRQFAGELLRTHQDRPARFEYQPLDDLLRLVIMRLDRDERQILQPRPYRKILRNIRRGKPLKPLLVAYAKASGRSIERLQQVMRVRYAPYSLGRRRIFEIARNGYLRPD